MNFEYIDLGLIPYAEAEAIQLARHAEVMDGGREAIFLLEHPKTITFGRQGGRENLHVSEAFLAQQSITLAQAARGGNITCHFPGQLVAYPVMRLDKRPGGIPRFFADMDQLPRPVLQHRTRPVPVRPDHPVRPDRGRAHLPVHRSRAGHRHERG